MPTIEDLKKEFNVRILGRLQITLDTLNLLGLNAGNMVKTVLNGSGEAEKAFNETISRLMSMEDPLERKIAGINIFGTQWVDQNLF